MHEVTLYPLVKDKYQEWMKIAENLVGYARILFPEILDILKIAVIILNIKQRGFASKWFPFQNLISIHKWHIGILMCYLLTVMYSKDWEGMANSVDPDQTAPRSSLISGLRCLHKNLESLWYSQVLKKKLKIPRKIFCIHVEKGTLLFVFFICF